MPSLPSFSLSDKTAMWLNGERDYGDKSGPYLNVVWDRVVGEQFRLKGAAFKEMDPGDGISKDPNFLEIW